jgi:hypothetical protein
MVRLTLDLDDELYEVLAALGRDHGCSVEEESSILLSEAGWREQAVATVAHLQAARRREGDGVHDPNSEA